MKLCLSLLALLSGVLLAQEQAPKHTLRILPLGDPPPFRQEIRDGVRYEIPAEEGTIPPRNLSISSKPPEGQEPVKYPLKLRLGYLSEVLSFPLPADRKIDADLEAGGSWLKIPLAKGNSTLALVYRGGKDWYEPRVLCVPDDGKAGDFLFVNVTAKPMGVTWGGEKLKLNPGTSMVRRIPQAAKGVDMSILYPAPEGGLKPCLSTRVEAAPGTRQQFIIYAADGKDKRMPVKVLPLSDKA